MWQPVVVVPIQDPVYEYELVHGERRYWAVVELGLPEIPAIIQDGNKSELDLILNNHRSNNFYSEIVAIKEIVKNGNKTIPEISSLLDLPQPKIKKLFSLTTLIPSALEKLRLGDISISSALKLCKLSPEQQEEILNKNGRKMKGKDIASEIRKIKMDSYQPLLDMIDSEFKKIEKHSALLSELDKLVLECLPDTVNDAIVVLKKYLEGENGK